MDMASHESPKARKMAVLIRRKRDTDALYSRGTYDSSRLCYDTLAGSSLRAGLGFVCSPRRTQNNPVSQTRAPSRRRGRSGLRWMCPQQPRRADLLDTAWKEEHGTEDERVPGQEVPVNTEQTVLDLTYNGVAKVKCASTVSMFCIN